MRLVSIINKIHRHNHSHNYLFTYILLDREIDTILHFYRSFRKESLGIIENGH